MAPAVPAPASHAEIGGGNWRWRCWRRDDGAGRAGTRQPCRDWRRQLAVAVLAPRRWRDESAIRITDALRRHPAPGLPATAYTQPDESAIRITDALRRHPAPGLPATAYTQPDESAIRRHRPPPPMPPLPINQPPCRPSAHSAASDTARRHPCRRCPSTSRRAAHPPTPPQATPPAATLLRVRKRPAADQATEGKVGRRCQVLRDCSGSVSAQQPTRQPRVRSAADARCSGIAPGP